MQQHVSVEANEGDKVKDPKVVGGCNEVKSAGSGVGSM